VKRKKMKIVTFAVVLALSAVLLTLLSLPTIATPPPGGYAIDGNLSEWGVNPGTDWNSETAKVQIEENAPSGGDPGVEQCDIEALYIDEDDNGPWIYFAIVTSMPKGGIAHPFSLNPKYWMVPGDLALDLYAPPGYLSPFDSEGRYGFEYGVKLTSHDYTPALKGTPVPGHIGSVFKDPVWVKVTDFYAQNNADFSNMVQDSDPSSSRSEKIWDATDSDIAYVEDDWTEGGTKNYVIEFRIPKSALEITGSGVLNMMATQSCTNDLILGEISYTPIPEFATIAIPTIAILGLFLFFNNRKRRKED
jgi:hypothetical protein